MELATAGDILRSGPLDIWPERFEALVEGRRLSLTSRELKLLEALARRTDRVTSREELCAVAWNRSMRPDDRSVDVYVSRIRAKLEDAAPEWRFVHTHFGFGYRFSAERLHPFHNPATPR